MPAPPACTHWACSSPSPPRAQYIVSPLIRTHSAFGASVYFGVKGSF